MDKEIIQKEIELKELKEKKNKEFREKNKKIIRYLSLALALAIFFNFGCLVITNALVIKANPDAELVEANPATSAVYGFKAADIIKGLSAIFFNLIIWAVISASYLNMLFKITSKGELLYLASMVTFLFVLTFINFGNDAGFALGVLLFK